MEIRKANIEDIKGIAKVHVDTWKSTYGGLVPVEFLNSLSVEKSESRFKEKFSELESSRQSLYVALNQDSKVVGFAHGGPERSEDYPNFGEIYAIYISDRYQRQGIGHQLVDKLFSEFKDNRFSKIIIWALRGNKYSKFYEDLGGKQTEHQIKTDKNGLHLDEVGFTWDLSQTAK